MASRASFLILFLIAAAVGVIVGAWALPLTGYAKTASHGSDAVAGVCMYSNEDVLNQSKLGKNANQRLEELIQGVQAQIEKDSKPLAQRVQAFNKKAGSLNDADRKKEQQALQQDQQKLRREAQTLNARLHYTSNVITHQINEKIEPLLGNVYKSHNCGVLFERDAVIKGNQGNDLTPDVVAALNKESTTIDFDLLQLPKQSSDKNKQQDKKQEQKAAGK